MDAQLLIRSSRDKKAYRLKCRFKIEPAPSPVRDAMAHMRWMSRLETEKVRVAEMFVRDLKVEGWENLPGYGFRMRGPMPHIEPVEIHMPPRLSANEMLPQVAQGARCLDKGEDYAKPVPTLAMSEWWEFEISGVFAREEILTEYPDPHEEIV